MVIPWYIKFGIPFIVGCLISGGVVWKVQGLRIDRAKLNLEKVQTQLITCQEANKTNQTTITSLRDESAKSQKACDTRLRQKEATIIALRKIDALRPSEPKPNVIGGSNEGQNNGRDEIVPPGNNSGGSDRLLDALNGMFISTSTDR